MATAQPQMSPEDRLEAVRRETERVRQALEIALSETATAETELISLKREIEKERQRQHLLEVDLDDLEVEMPDAKERRAESSRRLDDLVRRYDDEVATLSGDNSSLRIQKTRFNDAMDALQRPLVEALTAKFASKLKPPQKIRSSQ